MSATQPDARVCIFCGSSGPLTREHVLGNWLSRIGLDDGPVEYFAGPLNRLSTPMGVGSPFQQTVRNVCAACNNGWMGKLEEAAKRVLTPLVLGETGSIDAEDRPTIALWLHKTALISMLVSSADDREQGYGLPPSEYALLYKQRETLTPLPESLFWIGRYAGELRLGSVSVTPLVAAIEGLPEPDLPHGYAMSVALRAPVLHGLRFTDLPYPLDVATQDPLEFLWPLGGDLAWSDPPLSGSEYRALAGGRRFVVPEPELSLRPWRLASELEASQQMGSRVELPLLCGKHVAYYPADLVYEAQRARFYWFMTGCDCDIAYLIHTERDGAHAKAADTRERIEARYEALSGTEFELGSVHGRFTVKRDEG